MSESALIVVGGGTMARAIVTGCAEAGVLDPARVFVAEPDAARRQAFTRAFPSATAAIDSALHEESGEGSTPVLLAVKPQSLAGVGVELRPLLERQPRMIMSILAGVDSEKLRAVLGAAPIIRLMPNTPASIRQGVTGLARGAGADESNACEAKRIFAALGPVIEIDESLMNAFTALAGSGPAYLYYLAEAMIAAGERMGFDPATSALVVRQTLLGASMLWNRDDRSPRDLRSAVTSKEGTTAAATDHLDAAGVLAAIEGAILAARDRGKELARLA